MGSTRIAAAVIAAVLTPGGVGPAYAGNDPAAGPAGSASDPQSQPRLAVYGQATFIEQETDDFRAPYAGTNSLSPAIGRETADATLFLGARLWRGAEAWVDPEVDQGFGLDDTTGLAGFSSGEAYKVGSHAPYFRLQRAFLRQTIDLGGKIGDTGAAPNQFALRRSADRLIVSVGKLSVVDIFDVNRYAHDPRTDFLNWSVIDTGAFDYAADAWGYSVGGALEWYTGRWAWRAGVFDLSDVPNSAVLEPGFHEYQLDFEAEHRHTLLGEPGKIDLTVFESHGRMALLKDAIAYGEAVGSTPEVAPVRRYRKRDGVFINVEQQVSASVGLFARVGGAGGNVETYEFTDIDRTVSAGVSVSGRPWHRAQDTIGIAGVLNALSGDRRQYLAAGGLGILVGDGKLPHAGHESILETYYELAALSRAHVTLDYQRVGHPAYNRDRGPVSIFALRLHVEL